MPNLRFWEYSILISMNAAAVTNKHGRLMSGWTRAANKT